ncbi:glycosyltransferase family 4 protein [Candidatus Saccharibacteria bacterium]|nr:glycosyltransferase family 4 protein [Candidatus Saccharibacteria bacterium]
MIENNYLSSLFELETCLSHKDTKSFLNHFKELLGCIPKSRVDFTKNPGLTLYTPSKTKNLKSRRSILILIHELSRTGAPVVAADTARALSKNGYFVTIITMRRGPLLEELLAEGIPVIFDRELALTHDSRQILSSKNNHMYIDDFIKSFDQTIIITAVYYNLVKRYSDKQIPIIWWLHEGTATYDNLATFMPKQLGPSVKVYAGGEYALAQLKNYHLPYKAKILNYGVTDTFSKPVLSDHQKNDKVKFILPGSIGRRKGQKILLDAIKSLPVEYQKLSEFIFIGDIVSEADVEGKTIKDQLILASQNHDNITYLTSVTRDELFNLYSKIDVLVLPSLDDPMPVVATESLMLEKIVLCSDTTGTSYYLQDGKNGFVFKSNSPTHLCDKIRYIIDHRDKLSKIGQNGRKVYQTNFSMDTFEKNLLSIVEETK